MTVTTVTQRRLIAVFVGVLLLAPALAAAEPSPATGLIQGASSRRDLSGLNVTSIDAQAGNVTQLDINALSITKSWQGYYGNISGNIILADANNRSLYEWGNGTSLKGEVFASRNGTVDWPTINCGDAGVISTEETFLGQAPSDADSVAKTFSQTTHPSFLVGTTNITGCPSTYTYVNGSAQSSDYAQILLADDVNNTVYTTLIDHGATGYDGKQHDFELLVGQNGHQGGPATTTYYFFTELS